MHWFPSETPDENLVQLLERNTTKALVRINTDDVNPLSAVVFCFSQRRQLFHDLQQHSCLLPDFLPFSCICGHIRKKFQLLDHRVEFPGACAVFNGMSIGIDNHMLLLVEGIVDQCQNQIAFRYGYDVPEIRLLLTHLNGIRSELFAQTLYLCR